MSERYRRSIVWLRRDLRLDDNVALARAAEASDEVLCAFVVDPVLLRSERIGAPIVCFFFDALGALRADLRRKGSDLAILEGDFAHELGALARRVRADALFFNVDYEPEARSRDAAVTGSLREAGTAVHAFVDHVYFGEGDVLQSGERPYTVFTPYRRRWYERHAEHPHGPVNSRALAAKRLVPKAEIGPSRETPAPEEFGFTRLPGYPRGGEEIGKKLLDAFVRGRAESYDTARNAPADDATSHLSPHLRAGTVGIRRCVAAILEARHGVSPGKTGGYDTWLSELIWRDFYQQILAHFPHVATGPFLERAREIAYPHDEAQWKAWESGRTGYPIVDAAMKQIRETGWMHNRLRMIVASFLTKDQLLDYRLGERYFEQHLADADLAANNGGWQWSSSTGTDAAPYFRIFNPVLQGRKFDPDGAFIRKMLPELARLPAGAIHEPWTLSPLELGAAGVTLGETYPRPVVDHKEARGRALAFLAPLLGSHGGAPRASATAVRPKARSVKS